MKKILEYGLYLLVFLLPLQTRLILKPGNLNGGYFEYGTISLYGTDILLILLLGLFLLLVIKNRKIVNDKLQISNFWWIFGGLEFIIFISIFFADDKLIAIYKYIWFLLGAGLFLLLNQFDYKKAKLTFSFLLGVFLQALLGAWQFLNQYASSIKYFGIAEHDPSVLGVSVVETIGRDGFGERWLRAYGGLDHPNILGGFLAIGILVAILFLINSRRKLSQSDEHQINYYKYLILGLYLVLLISLVTLFFTFSRSAWLACGAGIATMLVVAIIKKDWLFQREILKIVLFSGILVFILFINFDNLVLTRVKAQARLEQKSNFERIESYKNSYEVIKNNFFFGVGIGNYSQELARTNPNQPAYAYQPVHNVFLLVVAEIGIFGFLAFIFLFIYLFYFLIKNKNSQKIGLLISLIILLSLDHYLWSLHFGVLFLFLSLSFLKNP